jgi:hypothetical protein
MLAATVEQLRAVALSADDGSGYFPAMYARVTQEVQRAGLEGRFGDSGRMTRFAETFAGWYLRPRSGSPPVPGSWQAAWDVAGDERLLIVQHLLLGINAHVNHDLPQVVVELAGGDDPRTLQEDFLAINRVLAETYHVVLRDLGRVSRWVNVAAAWDDGRLFNFSLATARDQAWRAALGLHALDGDARVVAVAELDRLARVLAYCVTRPNRPASWLVAVARHLEERDASKVTAALLGPLR